jgi:hypothetical protein
MEALNKASAYINKSMYNAGFYPKADYNAQLRCFAYLEKAIVAVDGHIQDAEKAEQSTKSPRGEPADDIAGLYKNQRVILTSARDMMASFQGSLSVKKADRFWETWDGCKKIAFEMVEGRDQPEGSFAQQLNELEEGRYKN